MRRQVEDGFAGLLRSCADINAGKQIHTAILSNSNLQNCTFLGNLIIEMYGRCSSVQDAHEAFAAIPQPNAFSWSLLLQAYAQNGHLHMARKILDLVPSFTVVSWTNMLNAYAQNGNLQEARMVFENMKERNIVTWSALIAAYAQWRHLSHAKTMFRNMPEWNAVVYNAVLSAHAENGDLPQVVHCFNEMMEHTQSSWNALIAAYAQNGHLDKARDCFYRMSQWNVVSLTAMVTAYTVENCVGEAKSLFDTMPERNIVSWNAMVSALELDMAVITFERMPQQNVASWNAMVVAYSKAGNLCQARATFDSMLDKDADDVTRKDSTTWITMLACYCKAGRLDEARELLFNKYSVRNTAAWSLIVSSHAQNGHFAQALELYRHMELDGVQPSEVSIVSVLGACSHGGRLGDAHMQFVCSVLDHGFVATSDCYYCMVDVLGRAGRLDVAEELIDSMPFMPNAVVWKAFLSACRVHGDVQRGERAAQHVAKLDPHDSSPYLLLTV